MNTNAIEIRGLIKNYPTFKLGPLDLTVPRGAIYGLIGPNGAGKTTTIDLIFGMGRNDGGEIRVLGLDHRANEVELKRRAAYVSPDLNFQVWGRIGKAIRFVRGFYPDWDNAYCAELMKAFHLSDADMVRIRQLHEGYMPQCKKMCALLAAKKSEVQAALADGTNVTAAAQQKLIELGELRAQCQAQMLRHFIAVSQAMPPEQGRRYLAEMQRLTLGFHEEIEQSMTPPAGHEHHQH